MPAITFGGLSSGLDTTSLIEQLVSIERNAAARVTTRRSNIDTQKSIISSLSSSLSTLATAARGLDLDTEVKPRAVSVSDSRVGVAVSSAASAGVHEFRVTSLAAAQVTQSRAFTGTSAGLAGAGSLDITVGGATKSITWTASDSLDAIATRINGADAKVNASVLRVDDTNYRLVVSAKESGTANAPTFVETGDALGLADPLNVKVPATNAVVNVNGIDIVRSSNVISDALSGVTLTLANKHEATDPTTKATVTLDTTALADKMKKLVDAFNTVNAALHIQLDYTGTKKGESTLFGDSTLRQLQTSIGAVASNAYGDTNIAAVGITRDRTGTMTLDTAKLTEAIGKDPDAVAKLFVTGGFATAVSGFADQYTRATDGVLATKTQALTERQKILQDQIDRINKKADDLDTRLTAQFASLEQAMTRLRSQSSYLSAF
ncbi:MAG: flagellar filament capping protein FliD [Kofleriaceae bacterium]